MIDELMPFAWQAYQSFGQMLNIECIAQKPVIDFFPTPQMRLAFIERYERDQQFLSLPENENDWLPFIQYDFGYGIIQPAYLTDIQLLLSGRRDDLSAKSQLRNEYLDPSLCIDTGHTIQYKDITSRKIIFCDGIAGFNNPFFNNLPYGLNKGEMILVEIPGLPTEQIIKKGYNLVPWQGNIFWLGSTYLWEFEDDQPSKSFYESASNWLSHTLKMPFTIVEHHASVRPATVERKPFVGLHPSNNKIGILNGMGTKGCSLAPFFANQLVNHLLLNEPIMADANVQRFKRILSR